MRHERTVDLLEVVTQALEPYDIPTGAGWNEMERREPAQAVLNALGLTQIGWRQNNGTMCFGHEHHHALDGVEWCEPVYVVTWETA